MQRVRKGQPWIKAECNYAGQRTHMTPAQAAVAEFLAAHPRFTRLDMRAAGLTEQQVVYHLHRAEQIGVVRKIAERFGNRPAIYEVCGEY